MPLYNPHIENTTFVLSPLSLFPVFLVGSPALEKHVPDLQLLAPPCYLLCYSWPICTLVFSFSMQPECAMTGYPNPNDVVCSPSNNML